MFVPGKDKGGGFGSERGWEGASWAGSSTKAVVPAEGSGDIFQRIYIIRRIFFCLIIIIECKSKFSCFWC